MSSLKIVNRTSILTDLQVLDYVRRVMQQGRISRTIRGEQYCFATTFQIGTNPSESIAVYVHKAKSGMEVFTLSLIPPRKRENY